MSVAVIRVHRVLYTR